MKRLAIKKNKISAGKIIQSIFKTFLLSLMIVGQVHFAYAQTVQGSLIPNGQNVFLDNNGKPLSSGQVYFYNQGTTTPKITYEDINQTIPNTNPLILDASGRPSSGNGIWGTGTYRQIVKDKLSNLIWDVTTTAAGGGSSGPTSTGDGDLVGTIKPWAGMTAPNQYMFTYGQTLNRATYAALYNAITSTQSVFCTSGSANISGLSDTTNFWIGMSVELGCVPAGYTTIIAKTSSTVTLAVNANASSAVNATFFPWGNGDHSTTFTLPDFRGFTLAGNNIMGGSASSVLTTTYFGSQTPNGTGAAGGSQSSNFTLVAGNLPSVNFTNSGITVSNSNLTVGGNPYTNTCVNALGNCTGGAQNAFMITNTGSTSAGAPSSGAAISAQGAAASGGTSTPVVTSLVQPTKTANYIIKVTPDQNSSSASGVTSLGLMIGDIACGTGLLCTGNNISVTSTPLVVGNTPITSGTATRVLYDNAGALGEYSISGTGNVAMTASPAFTGSPTVTSATAAALSVGLNGATNPAFNIDASTALSATGLNIKSAAAAGGVALSVLSSSVNENLSVDAKGSGSITFGGTSTGSIIHTRATTLSAALTYGSVTLNNAVTGTGNMVLSGTPTLVTPVLGAATGTSVVVTNGFVSTSTYGGAFSDGIYLDYSSPTARISAGPADNVCFYNGATLAATQLGCFNNGSHLVVEGVKRTGATGTGILVFASSPSIGSLTVTTAFTATGLVTYADMATAAIATGANYFSGASSVLVPASVIYQAETTTTFGTTTTFDFSTFINTAVTLTGNITTQTLSNVAAGKSGQIRFIQDATGSRTSVWNSIFKFAGGATPALSTAANAIDVLFYSCTSSTLCYASLVQNMK